jgi:hypothetical protein
MVLDAVASVEDMLESVVANVSLWWRVEGAVAEAGHLSMRGEVRVI